MAELIASQSGALIYAGQEVLRADVLAAARERLASQDVGRHDVDEMLVDRPGLVMPAWWAGEVVGFCGPGHPDAVAVTVVNLPIPPEGSGHAHQ